MCLGIPGKVVEIYQQNDLPMGKVEFGGVVKEVCLAYTPEAAVGDYVIVHVGFAISRIDEAEAAGDLLLSGRDRPGGQPRRDGMKYLDEYRDAEAARQLAAAIARTTTRPWNIMEVCGGQTHAILRFGLDEMLPPQITLIHGPGCPVCVTPHGDDRPGGGHRRAAGGDLLLVRRHAAGAGLDEGPAHGEVGRGRRADRLLADGRRGAGPARIPERQVVFFAVGFETTAPANAMAVAAGGAAGAGRTSPCWSRTCWCRRRCCAVLGSPAQPRAGLPGRRPRLHDHGHGGVSADRRGSTTCPIVVTGFEPLDILQGVLMCVEQLEAGRAEVENQYARSVRPEGNRAGAGADSTRSSRSCRGSGGGSARFPPAAWPCARPTRQFDADRRFGVGGDHGRRAGRVHRRRRSCRATSKPHDCPAFGIRCTPERPLGAPMVSAEGACAAYYRYRRQKGLEIGD